MIRILLAIAALEDLKLYIINILNAFIELILKEEIYIEVLPSIDITTNKALLLLRSLYSLK